jgi:hypothetical protein
MSWFSGFFGGGSKDDDRGEARDGGSGGGGPSADAFVRAADATASVAGMIPVGPLGNVTSAVATAGHIANEGMTTDNGIRIAETVLGAVNPVFGVAEAAYNTSTLFTGAPSSTELIRDATNRITEPDADRVAWSM